MNKQPFEFTRAILAKIEKKPTESSFYHPQSRRHIDLIDFMKSSAIHLEAPILDVGCGVGQLAKLLSQSGFKTIDGTDWLQPNALGENLNYFREFKQQNLNEDGLKSYASESYDTIVCSDVIEHLENPAFIFRELGRVLKPNGTLFVTLPNAFSIFERFRWLFNANSGRYRTEANGEWGHITILPDGPLKSLLNRANLKIISTGKTACFKAGFVWLPYKKWGSLMGFCLLYQIQKS